ncbi:unnamed protein product [Adineta ricciae]|uniref:Otopetrin-2 n=1 Tax=Adineta ricciae TaxID=249248 RepID=A0A815CLG7_ADIRI|nr:unnamed protein product [Adineta ricciae]CAF1590147.1 unnamed protein product [Adineta ricciae]
MKSSHKYSVPDSSRQIVRDTVRQFDMLGQTNYTISSPPPPLPPPPHRPSIPMKINNKQINSKDDSPTSSLNSFTNSTHSELIMDSAASERRHLVSINTSNSTPIARPKPTLPSHTANRPTKFRRRTPPPIPTESTPNKQQNTIYINRDNKTNNHRDKYQYGVETDSPRAFKAFARPATVYTEQRVSSSAQTDELDLSRASANNNQPRRIERPPPPPLPPLPLPLQASSNPSKADGRSSIGLEIINPETTPRRYTAIRQNGLGQRPERIKRTQPIIEDYEIEEEEDDENQDGSSETDVHSSGQRPPPSDFAKTYLRSNQKPTSYPPNDDQTSERERTLPISNLMMEIGALLIVFVVCMVLVVAIKTDVPGLQTTMLGVYIYVYAVSVVWMLWCTFDIIKFRQQWMQLTGSASTQEVYMGLAEHHSDTMFYFPDVHNTGGLFMRIGAGLLCMGSLILTLIELAKTIATVDVHGVTRTALEPKYYSSVSIARSIAYVFRFLFHCVQFSFLFRYGNLIINRYHALAKFGLLHLVIANFCSWFEAIVIETLEEIHKNTPTKLEDVTTASIDFFATIITSTSPIDNNGSNDSLLPFIRAASADSSDAVPKNGSALAMILDIEGKVSAYLYPCLIEYSLISLTVFFIMWRNVGKTEKRSLLRFGARHVFTVNCARASRGLLIGGILLLLTILTLIPTYMLTTKEATIVTHVTELVLLVVALFTVLISFMYTSKLLYDHHAHVDTFDQGLILVTTIGDFAYSFFGLFAALFFDKSKIGISLEIEMSIGFLAIFQTLLQTNFILDTLKRRTRNKQEIRSKPGRETVTALLLMNLAIWMHDSLSAKKVRLNPLQTAFYDPQTWAIIQAFTSPLSIFYRFHSSVCLADIWQEVYQDGDKEEKYRLVNGRNNH